MENIKSSRTTSRGRASRPMGDLLQPARDHRVVVATSAVVYSTLNHRHLFVGGQLLCHRPFRVCGIGCQVCPGQLTA